MGGEDSVQYEEIECWCKEAILKGADFLFDDKLFRFTLSEKAEEWKGFSVEALQSLLRNIHLVHVKTSAPKVRKSLQTYLKAYRNGESITTISRKANFSPFLMSRYMVQEMTILKSGKKELAKIMRDPLAELSSDTILEEFQEAEDTLLGDKREMQGTRMAMEVKNAIISDPMYGPKHDLQRHFVGVEYEVALERQLSEMGIPFETESQLREKGSARTPDILLSLPIAFRIQNEWRVVCWIDSKALFGDVNTHKNSVLPQAESYVHRYGPGLILYWFGHAPSLTNTKGDITTIEWQLPKNFMWPTGEKTISK